MTVWQRNPVRVSFESGGGVKQTFSVRGHVVDAVNDAEEEEEGKMFPKVRQLFDKAALERLGQELQSAKGKRSQAA